MIKQLPVLQGGAEKGQVRSQFAALCYRVRKGKVQVLLITSRKSGRWIIPKGWPMVGKTPAACALKEAWEEAGVNGAASDQCLGVYSYAKAVGDDGGLPCLAMVYAVAVKSLAKQYPEKGDRKRRWVSRKQAARMVTEPELARIIADFEPRDMARRA